MYTQPLFFRDLKDYCETVDWLNYDLPERDWPIRPLLAAMNTHPGIATRWSCPGHPEDDPLREEGRDLYKDMQLYVTCAVDEAGFAALMRFTNAVNQWPDAGPLKVKLFAVQLQAFMFAEEDPTERRELIQNLVAKAQAKKFGLTGGRWTAFSFEYDFRYDFDAYCLKWRNEVIDRLVATWLEVNPV